MALGKIKIGVYHILLPSKNLFTLLFCSPESLPKAHFLKQCNPIWDSSLQEDYFSSSLI